MKYTIDDETLLDYSVMTPREVAEQLENCGAIQLEADERIGEVRLECGTDLEIDIEKVIEDDPRCSGYVDHTETFDKSDIEYHFEAADYYVWAKDEDGNDVLLCFGC
jgi:hypothetical protein